MRAGFAKRCITPPLGVELCGYGYYLERRCMEVQDDLFVRCLALESGAARYMIFSADLIGLSEAISDEIRAATAQKTGWACEEILLHCTHTHTGPATAMLEGCGVMDAEYLSTLCAKFTAAAEGAILDMAEVTALQHVHRNIEPIGFNRAAVDGPVDPAVRGLKFERGEKPPVALVNHACHAVARGVSKKVSADYPGAVCRWLEDKGYEAMFVNGICGDIDPDTQPRKLDFPARDEAIVGYAERICRGFEAGLKPAPDMVIRSARFPASIPLENVTVDDLDEIIENKAGYRPVGEIWKQAMLANMPLAKEEPFMVSAVRVGGLTLCTLPYETFSMVGILIRQAAPEWDIAVLGCSDGIRGYLPSSDQYASYKYAYLGSAWLYLRPLIAREAVEKVGKEIGVRLAEVLKD